MPRDEWWRETRKILADGVKRLRERCLEGPAPVSSHKTTQPTCGEEERSPKCPKCGREMVLRVAEKGDNMGLHFWGCPGYPVCKGAVDLVGSGKPKKKYKKKVHKVRECRYKIKRRIR